MSDMLHTIAPALVTGLLLLVFVVPPAQAQNNGTAYCQTLKAGLERDICDLLVDRDQNIKRLLTNKDSLTEAQRQDLENLINDQIDFAEMGRQALGPHWADLSETQRTEFIDLFGAIVRGQSLSDLDIYTSTVSYDQISVTGDSAYVKTTITYKDTPSEVDYIMGLKDGTWWVYDIILKEVSTVDGYARSFQTYIRKRGFDALMENLRKRHSKMQTTS